ncbi:MAG: YceI family protein [Pseudomonadota bacterium]
MKLTTIGAAAAIALTAVGNAYADGHKKSETMEEEAVELSAAPAGEYALDKGHGYITFTYDHQGYSKPFVRWRSWDATLNWNPDAPEESAIEVTIDTSSIDTGVDKFDDHMRNADLFDVEKFPEITFTSTGLERTGPNTGVLTGDLTILGVTKAIDVDMKINKAAYNQRGESHKLGFSGRATLNRSDFGVDYAVPFVGDKVKIIIEAEFDEVKA